MDGVKFGRVIGDVGKRCGVFKRGSVQVLKGGNCIEQCLDVCCYFGEFVKGDEMGGVFYNVVDFCQCFQVFLMVSCYFIVF